MNNLCKNTRDLTEPVSADSGRENISNEQVRSNKVVPIHKDKKSKTTKKKKFAGGLMNYPDINSSNPQEKKDAMWINEMRKAKAGLPSKLIWFPILDEDAKKYGFPNIFDKKYITNLKMKGNKNGN